MQRTVKIDEVMTWDCVCNEIQMTKIRACAIIENAVRSAENIETEYDQTSTTSPSRVSNATETWDEVTIYTIKCGWKRAIGFYGVESLNSNLLPRELEKVYRTLRMLAIQQAKADFAAENHGTLYVRQGSKFVKF